MMKDYIRKNWFFIFAGVAVTAILITLFVLFKWSKALESFLGDDLKWQDTPFSFESIIEDNGRYLGNILVIIISKINWLRIVAGVVASAALIYVLSLNSKGDRGVAFIAAAALFFVMPNVLFNQTVGWMSGFANYIPASLIVVAIAVIFKNEFADEPFAYGKATPYLTAALGVIGAMFIETVAIGNVIIGIALLIYHFVRFKKPCVAIIAFLVGAVVGAILVFVDPVYLSVFKGEDPEAYRKVSLSLSGIITLYCEQFQYYFVFNNYWLNLCLVGLFAWMFIREFGSLKTSSRAVIIVCLAVQTLYMADCTIDKIGIFNTELTFRTNAVRGMFTFLFCLAILLEVIFLLKDINLKLNCLYILGCILVYTLPLLAVTLESTLVPRTFIFAYMLFASLAIILLDKNIAQSGVCAKRINICVAVASSVVMVAVAAIYIAKYSVRVDWLEIGANSLNALSYLTL